MVFNFISLASGSLDIGFYDQTNFGKFKFSWLESLTLLCVDILAWNEYFSLQRSPIYE